MSSNAARALLGAALMIVAIGLFVVLRGGDGGDGGVGGNGSASGQATEPPGKQRQAGEQRLAALPTIVVKNGEPVGGIVELEFGTGERVRFEVDSDVGDEVHVHGYDIAKDVEAGGSVSFDFPATIEGIFEVELEERAEQIAELRVVP